jgi:hypothetical protein
MYDLSGSLDKELALISCRAITSFTGDDRSHLESSLFGTAWASSVLRGSTKSIEMEENGIKKSLTEFKKPY